MNELYSKDQKFMNDCKTLELTEEEYVNLKKQLQEIKDLTQSLSEDDYHDWMTVHHVFYEMMDKTLKNLEQSFYPEVKEEYSKLIRSIALYNEHFQNVITGDIDFQKNPNAISTITQSLNKILTDLNNFYQKLFKTTEALETNMIPVIEPWDGIEARESYLKRVKSMIVASFPIKEREKSETLDDIIFEPQEEKDPDESLDILTFTNEIALEPPLPKPTVEETKEEILEETQTIPEINIEDTLEEIMPMDEPILEEILEPTLIEEDSPKGPILTPLKPKALVANPTENLYVFPNEEENTQEQEIEAILDEGKKDILQTLSNDSVALETIAKRRENYEGYRNKLYKSMDDIASSIEKVQSKVANREPLIEAELIYYNSLVSLSDCFTKEIQRLSTIKEEDIKDIKKNLNIPNHDMSIYEIYDYIKNGRPFPFFNISKKEETPLLLGGEAQLEVPEEPKEKDLPLIEQWFTTKEKAQVYKDDTLETPFIPLFVNEGPFMINEVIFKDNEGKEVKCYSNDQVLYNSRLGYVITALGVKGYGYFKYEDTEIMTLEQGTPRQLKKASSN